MKKYISVLFIYLLVFNAQAGPLYLEKVEQFTYDEKKLQEAHEQIKEHSDIALKDDIFVPSFHKQGQKGSTDKKPFCHDCHKSQPHAANERKRSFLNMHSRYISCETCHFRPENIQLEYRWLNYNEAGNEQPAKRVVPFYDDEAVLLFSDHELAVQAKETWGGETSINTSLDQAKLKLRLHAPLDEEGPECMDCHGNKEQLLDLGLLEYSSKEINKLQHHSIPRFFKRFTKEEQRLRMTDLLQ